MLSIRKKVNKLLQDENKFKRVRCGDFRGIFDLDFCAGQETDFICKIEQIMSSGTFIKRGSATTVVKANYAGKDIVIKRYNYQGFLHAIRHTIKGTRAEKSWKYSLYLLEAGIRTPRALAYITSRKHGLSGASYIINECIDTLTLSNLLHKNQINDEIIELVSDFCSLLQENLKKLRISHNDLKPSNILIKDHKVYLIDLDGMLVHNWGLYFLNRHSKDMTAMEKRILTPTKTANDK